MSKEDLAQIETIVRQQWCDGNSPWESWLSVDQDQALALIEMIPFRLRASPKPLAIPGTDPPMTLYGGG